MSKVLTLDVSDLATMSLMEDGSIVPSSFANITCSASDLTVFGFIPPLSGNNLNLGIKGPGSASILLTADCDYIDRYTNKPGTTTKTKSLNVSVTGNGPSFVVEIGN
jgi:hypothetical protein